MDAVAERALELMLQRDWVAIREVLHPYLHWIRGDGSLVRGRADLIAEVERGRVPEAPVAVELRDGQIYRWIEASDGTSRT